MVWGMLRREGIVVDRGKGEVNVDDQWRLYGVRKAGVRVEAGVEDLRTTKVYSCGVCNMNFGLEIYPTIDAFYFGHYVKCGVPQDWIDWGC